MQTSVGLGVFIATFVAMYLIARSSSRPRRAFYLMLASYFGTILLTFATAVVILLARVNSDADTQSDAAGAAAASLASVLAPVVALGIGRWYQGKHRNTAALATVTPASYSQTTKTVWMQRVTTALCPSRATYNSLQLNKRWWHRLGVVVFWLVLSLTAFVSWVVTSDAARQPKWSEPAPASVMQFEAERQVGAPVFQAADKVLFISPAGDLRLVGYTLQREAQAAGGQRALFVRFPDGRRGFIPQSDLERARLKGFSLIDVPRGYIVSDGQGDYPYWPLARNPRWWEVLMEVYGVTLLVLLVASYVLQTLYRIVLYIAFGDGLKSTPATD